MGKMVSGNGPQLEIDRQMIEVSTNLPQPDPKWTYTDHAGHAHAYGSKQNPYPSLTKRQSEPYWCDDCDDEHTDTWLECPLCGEKITPGTFIDPSPELIPGLTSYRIDGREVSPEEGEALLTQMRADRQAEAKRKAREKARPAEQAMRDEGLSEAQIQRVINRLVHGNPDGRE